MKKEFTPIAMFCNKEQFEAIKPKLDKAGFKIICLSDFSIVNYLCNFAWRKKDTISNFTTSDYRNFNREVHETWNERIFLEACGIETEETFEITKETIIKYKMKDEFPEVFKKKLEVGKWYKKQNKGWRLFLFCFSGNYGNESSYGFNVLGEWSEKLGVHKSDEYAEATEQEVFEALKNEAVKRGFVEGNYFIEPDNCVAYSNQKRLIKGSIKAYMSDNSMLSMSGSDSLIYKNGKWATIASTKTKEEAEKLLGVKIID